MPAIRWMGYAGLFCGIDSLKWELTQNRLEVSAEWTTKNRPFIIPKRDLHTRNIYIGLLVKSNAVIRRFKRDGGSGGPAQRKTIPKEWRRRDLIREELLTIKPWEAICKPQYRATVINYHYLLKYLSPSVDTKVLKDEPLLSSVIQFCAQQNFPVLIYQAHKNSDSGAISWSLTPSEIWKEELTIRESIVNL